MQIRMRRFSATIAQADMFTAFIEQTQARMPMKARQNALFAYLTCFIGVEIAAKMRAFLEKVRVLCKGAPGAVGSNA